MNVRVRATRDDDRLAVATLYAEVAEERDGIGAEPPVDVEARAASWRLEGDFLAEAEGRIIGSIHIEPSRHGFGEIGMAVALYRKFGFVEEGRRVRHYRRQSGELWDAIEMGLLL